MDFNQSYEQPFLILKLLITLTEPTMNGLVEHTGLSQSTINRCFALLRVKFNMKIEYVRMRQGAVRGVYVIQDWGIIDKINFVKQYGESPN